MKTCNSRNWTDTIDNNELATAELTVMGNRHTPIKHNEVLDMFRNKLDMNKLIITKEKGFLSPDKERYIYISDVSNLINTDYTFSIGFSNYNNEQKAFRPIFGETVFVCSNEMIKSENNGIKIRHTGDMLNKIGKLLDFSIVKFFEFMQKRTLTIEKMQNRKLEDFEVQTIIYHLVKENCFAGSFLSTFIKEYENPSYANFCARNVWSFQNAFTEALKSINNPLQKIQMTDRMDNILASLI